MEGPFQVEIDTLVFMPENIQENIILLYIDDHIVNIEFGCHLIQKKKMKISTSNKKA